MPARAGASDAEPILMTIEQTTAPKPARRRPRRAQRRTTIRLQPTSGFGRVLSPRELWRYRDLALQIAVRDVTMRYRQTALRRRLGDPAAGRLHGRLLGRLRPCRRGLLRRDVPYALFSLAALVPWTFFANALLLGSESLVMYKDAGLENLLPAHLHPGRGRRRRLASTSAISLADPARRSSSSTASCPRRRSSFCRS